MADKRKKHCWENAEVDRLICLYEERPCLWDQNIYSIRDARGKAFRNKGKMEHTESTTWKRSK